MSMRTKVQVQGAKQVIKRLNKLKRGVKNKILRKAITKSCQPVAKAAKANTPIETGLLKKSLGHKVKTYKDDVVGIVGPRRGMGKVVTVRGRKVYRDPVKYAHLVERGTVDSKPQPFLLPAWESNKQAISQILTNEIRQGIESEVR